MVLLIFEFELKMIHRNFHEKIFAEKSKKAFQTWNRILKTKKKQQDNNGTCQSMATFIGCIIGLALLCNIAY